MIRGLIIDPMCPRCNENEENIEHLFKNCIFSRNIWINFPVLQDGINGQESRKDWIIINLKNKSADGQSIP